MFWYLYYWHIQRVLTLVFGDVFVCVFRSLSSQTLEAKAELAALLGRQPGALKLESRLTQLLQEKEAVRFSCIF